MRISVMSSRVSGSAVPRELLVGQLQQVFGFPSISSDRVPPGEADENGRPFLVGGIWQKQALGGQVSGERLFGIARDRTHLPPPPGPGGSEAISRQQRKGLTPRLLHRLVATQPGENLGQLQPKAAIIGRAVKRSIEEVRGFGCGSHRACVRSGGGPMPSCRSRSARSLKVPGYAGMVAAIHCFRKPIMQRRWISDLGVHGLTQQGVAVAEAT